MGVSIQCLGVRTFKDWSKIYVCGDAVKNICSTGQLRALGYWVTLLRVHRIVSLEDEKEVLTANKQSMQCPITLVMINCTYLTYSYLHAAETEELESDPLDLCSRIQ